MSTIASANGVTAPKLAAIIPGRSQRSTKPTAKQVEADENLEVTGDVLYHLQQESVPALLDPVIPQVGISCLAGSSDTGKSMWARHFAIAVGCGQSNFQGFPLNLKHQSAIYIATEDNNRNTSFLIRKQSHQHAPEKLRGVRFIFDPDEPLNALRKSLKRKPADLVVIDTFGDIFNGQLNDSQHVRGMLKPYNQIANEYECQILFLHHTGKRTEDFAPNKSNLLGSQGFESKMRLVLELRRDHMDTSLRHLCIVKGNYLSSEVKSESYVLRFNEEHFTFSNTEQRVPLDQLARSTPTTEDPAKAKWALYLALAKQNVKGDELATQLGYKLRGAVSKLIKKAKDNGWEGSANVSEDVSNVSNGKQSEETITENDNEI